MQTSIPVAVLTIGFVSLSGACNPAVAAGRERLPGAATSQETERVYERYVVAADHPAASEAGAAMLARGGNVVDAAVATSLALSVARPASSGVGGGGFMVIWNAERREAVALDYRERAPKAATRDMFVDPDNPEKSRSELSRTGQLAVAVPGNVAGLCYALEHYGSLDLKTVTAPAVRLAKQGVPIDDHDREVQAAVLAVFAANPSYRKTYAALYEKYLNSGKPWKEGDRFHSPLRPLLELIADHGSSGFYDGPVARALVEESRRNGGLLSDDDLKAMKPVVRKPLRGKYGNREILTMPPPSSGGIALLETLNIIAAYEKTQPLKSRKNADRAGPDDPAYLHLLTEAMKHAFADRAEFLGDADFAEVPVKRLTSVDYAKELASRIDPKQTKPLEAYGRYMPVDDHGTSHFSIIDAKGNAVACTETINTRFGSFVVEPKYGIVLNNEMDDFAAIPSRPNAFGLIQSEKNAVEPGKKPLSSMSPTIVIEDGRAVYALGGSGGPRIISSTLEVLLNLSRFEMPVQEAVAAPRIHHQWLPDALYAEPPLYGVVKAPLEKKGHEVQLRSHLAAVQAAVRTKDGLRAASDPRKHGRPAGE